MNTQNVLSLLEASLEKLSGHAQKLAELIGEEGEALRTSQVNQLSEKLAQKQQLLTELASQDQELRTLLQRLGWKDDNRIDEFLAALPVTELLAAK